MDNMDLNKTMYRKRKIMKNVSLAVLIFLATGLAGAVKAQSLYDATGYRVARKTAANTYEVTGSTFTVKNGNLIPIFDGQLREDFGVNYYRKDGDRVKYYNTEDQCVGYYLPDTKRFVGTASKEGKEDYMAVIVDNDIYTLDSKPSYRMEAGFEPELVGFIFFFFTYQ
jgi:hypothetical protein